jgi:hypothetical protein
MRAPRSLILTSLLCLGAAAPFLAANRAEAGGKFWSKIFGEKKKNAAPPVETRNDQASKSSPKSLEHLVALTLKTSDSEKDQQIAKENEAKALEIKTQKGLAQTLALFQGRATKHEGPVAILAQQSDGAYYYPTTHTLHLVAVRQDSGDLKTVLKYTAHGYSGKEVTRVIKDLEPGSEDLQVLRKNLNLTAESLKAALEKKFP